MSDDTVKDNSEFTDKDDQTRNWLALGLPGVSLLLLIIISSTYLILSGDKAAAAQTIFNSTLPLIGTWVGTVLAFYFTSHSFNAAARNARAMINQLTSQEELEQILVKDVMIPMERAGALSIDETGDNIKIQDMLDRFNSNNHERLPIVDKNGCIKYMAHRSMIDRFLVKTLTANPGQKISDLTLANMLNDEDSKKVLSGSFKALHADSNLAHAKVFIDDKTAHCSDVFATEDGTPNTKALGWVTNVIIAEKATLS